MTKAPYATTFHRDGTVTVWDVYTQQWKRTYRPNNAILASLSEPERSRVLKHCQIRPEYFSPPTERTHA